MKSSLFLAVVFGILVGGAIFWLRRSVDTSKSAPQAAHSDSDEIKPEHPVPTQDDLADADDEGSAHGKKMKLMSFDGQSLEQAIAALFGADPVASLFNLEGVAGKIVLTVDSATAADELPPDRSFIKPLESDFIVQGKGNRLTISPDNYARYKPFLELVKSADARNLVALYVHFYPQLQSAYNELGNRKYFNDRVIEVINHILKTPDVSTPPHLVSPGAKYRYKYADLNLENLSVSQKALIRMGHENASVIKAHLRQIRKLLMPFKKDHKKLAGN